MIQLYEMCHTDNPLRPVTEGIAPTLQARLGTGGNNVPVLVENRDMVLNDQGGSSISVDNKSPTLRAEAHGNNPCVVDSYCIAGNTIDRKIENGGNGAGFQKDISYTLNTIDRHAVSDVEPQISGTLAAADGKGKNGQDINKFPIVESRIRRLTPTECERLQGLPDGWTDIEGASDSARYKAIGNGMAQPCADFIIRRIVECEEKAT